MTAQEQMEARPTPPRTGGWVTVTVTIQKPNVVVPTSVVNLRVTIPPRDPPDPDEIDEVDEIDAIDEIDENVEID